MKVELIAYTPNPDAVVAAAAKLCYSKSGVSDIQQKLDDKETERFVQMLVDMGHESPVEHCSFTFAIEGISRACSHQLVRHRIASYSQQSQRYVSLNNFEYIIPPEIENDSEIKQDFINAMDECKKHYNIIFEKLCERYYNEHIKDGMSEKAAKSKAEKKAAEDARFVLPNACETKIVVTMNIRSLFNFFRHRCCNRAQWEIRALAEKMLMLCKEKAPVLFKKAGPGCVAGVCPEGKMSCGKMNEMKDKYLG